MTKEKQIDEMAKAIFMNCNCGLFENEAKMIAEFVIDKQGYRKASEVVKEIFEEIEKMLLDNHIGHYKTTVDTWCYNFNNEIISEIAELKKKYTEEK